MKWLPCTIAEFSDVFTDVSYAMSYLSQTANGQVEAKVSCFYRRRDLSNALVTQADKHSSKSTKCKGT